MPFATAGLSGYGSPPAAVYGSGVQAIADYHDGNHEDTISHLEKMESASRQVIAHLERIAASGEDDASLLCRH